MLHYMPFQAYSYSLRLALIMAYFHQKFQKGSAKTAWHKFINATQVPSEALEDWAQRLDQLEIEVRRYGTTVSFDSYLEQWCVGTRAGAFLTALRKAKNPSKPGVLPEIYDRTTFDHWKTTFMANTRQIVREKERFLELQTKNDYTNNPPRRTNQRQHHRNRPPRGDDHNKAHRNTNSNAGHLNRDGPGYNKDRNPHSPLAKQEVKLHPTVNDRPKVKCYNCNMYGHFASKCPEVKRPRQQRMNQLKAQLATVSADYSAEECNTPEAIRDQLQLTVSALVSRLMQFHDNTEEDNQTEDSEPLKDEIPQQQHNVDNHNDSHSDDENSNV